MSHIADDVAKILASPMPRRRAFRLLGGVLAGGVLSGLGIRSAKADDHHDHEGDCGEDDNNCKRGQKCCGGRCIDTSKSQCCHNTPCPVGQTCCDKPQGEEDSSFCVAKPKTCSNSRRDD